jgi:2-phospho-L-lactate guanylyltransferase
MSSLKISAIIPVKTFSVAKTRLGIDFEKRDKLCRLMLKEILHTIYTSTRINSIILVSKDEQILKIGKKFNVIPIVDERESGVNNAVSLADKYLLDRGQNDASVVFPQDIPFMKVQDIDFLLNFQNQSKFASIVPSRKFDGTNALVRKPTNLMETHYDEDSYKIHLKVAKQKTVNTSLVFVRRIMLDIDGMDDIKTAMSQNEKPNICKDISDILQL